MFPNHDKIFKFYITYFAPSIIADPVYQEIVYYNVCGPVPYEDATYYNFDLSYTVKPDWSLIKDFVEVYSSRNDVVTC